MIRVVLESKSSGGRAGPASEVSRLTVGSRQANSTAWARAQLPRLLLSRLFLLVSLCPVHPAIEGRRYLSRAEFGAVPANAVKEKRKGPARNMKTLAEPLTRACRTSMHVSPLPRRPHRDEDTRTRGHDDARCAMRCALCAVRGSKIDDSTCATAAGCSESSRYEQPRPRLGAG